MAEPLATPEDDTEADGPPVCRLSGTSTTPSGFLGHDLFQASSPDRALSVGCQTYAFDYFLSYKKHHSTLGGVPEQIAKNLHDALEIVGYKGFFDTDDLEEVSKDGIAENIAKSKALIVFMTDETIQSEWCRFEWETANALSIPIKVVVDLSHFGKKEILDQVNTGPYHFLLSYQWLEYTDSTRRKTVQCLSGWLSDRTARRALGAMSPRHVIYTTGGALCIRDKDVKLQLFHPLFELFMVTCGLAYNPEAWSNPMRIWTRVARALPVACFAICLWRLIYATGPAYTDRYSCLYVVCIHLFVIHGVITMTCFLNSGVMKTLLEQIETSDLAMWAARRVHGASWWAAVAGLSVGAVASVSMIVIYLPLFLSSAYMSSPAGMAFGVCSSLLFISVAPVVLIQEFAVLTLLFIIRELLCHDFEAATCTLHNLLPTVGLRHFVQSGSAKITPTPTQMNRFSECWSNAWTMKLRLQRYVNPVLYVHFFFNMMGICIPYVYVFGDRFYLQLDLPWAQLAKPLMWWAYAACCYSATIILPALTCHGLESIADDARCLHTSGLNIKELVLVSMSIDPSWRISPLRVTGTTATVLTAPLLGSALCWALIFSSVVS